MNNTRNHLFHYSKSIITLDRDFKYSPQGLGKPKGLWISVGGDWKTWCEAERFNLSGVKHRHVVTLTKDANLLMITSASELDCFASEYGRRLYSDSSKTDDIDWSRVSAQHQGIVISPYIWTRRLEMLWYYGWDCASGCIWDLHAIKDLKRK